MWNNGSSRRGRRMSIDLPNMHVTPPKGADGFPQSFFPALPIAYMNGQYRICCSVQTNIFIFLILTMTSPQG